MSKQKEISPEDIMQQWYDAMDKENVGVQPKCSTILGAILSKYKIVPGKKDIWAEYQTVTGGEFTDW